MLLLEGMVSEPRSLLPQLLITWTDSPALLAWKEVLSIIGTTRPIKNSLLISNMPPASTLLSTTRTPSTKLLNKVSRAASGSRSSSKTWTPPKEDYPGNLIYRTLPLTRESSDPTLLFGVNLTVSGQDKLLRSSPPTQDGSIFQLTPCLSTTSSPDLKDSSLRRSELMVKVSTAL